MSKLIEERIEEELSVFLVELKKKVSKEFSCKEREVESIIDNMLEEASWWDW
jgi:hypothetical protein